MSSENSCYILTCSVKILLEKAVNIIYMYNIYVYIFKIHINIYIYVYIYIIYLYYIYVYIYIIIYTCHASHNFYLFVPIFLQFKKDLEDIFK